MFLLLNTKKGQTKIYIKNEDMLQWHVYVLFFSSWYGMAGQIKSHHRTNLV